MATYTKPQQRKKEESERLREERDLKFIDLGFERWQVEGFRKASGRARELGSHQILASILVTSPELNLQWPYCAD